MTAKVVQFKQIGPVTFIKNRRSKNIKISVKPDQTVRVSFPFYAGYADPISIYINSPGARTLLNVPPLVTTPHSGKMCMVISP